MMPVRNSLNELNSGVEALASICNGFFDHDIARVGSHRFDGRSPLMGHLGSVRSASVFGRVGIIHLHNQSAIQLLEVVSDAERDGPE